MKENKTKVLPLLNQICYSLGSLAFTLLERMIILYAVFYFLPPKELGLHNLVSDRTFFGVITITGAALLLGRILDGLADPVIATLSDNSRSRIGRRKVFLLYSALPLALTTFLVFTPPQPGQESLLNGIWLALMMGLFYIAFTAYVNPYLALMSELGHTRTAHQHLHFHGSVRFVGDGLHHHPVPPDHHFSGKQRHGYAQSLPVCHMRVFHLLLYHSLSDYPFF